MYTVIFRIVFFYNIYYCIFLILIIFFYLQQFFLDENECKYRPCDVFSHCTNTLGSFTCTCFPGYRGDGLHCEGKFLIFKFQSIKIVLLPISCHNSWRFYYLQWLGLIIIILFLLRWEIKQITISCVLTWKDKSTIFIFNNQT